MAMLLRSSCLAIGTYRAGGVQFAHVHVVYEGHVVGRVPVQGVEHAVKWDRLQQPVDRLHHLERTIYTLTDDFTLMLFYVK